MYWDYILVYLWHFLCKVVYTFCFYKSDCGNKKVCAKQREAAFKKTKRGKRAP